MLEQKFIAVKYGEVKLPNADWKGEDLTNLNSQIQTHLKEGWQIKTFDIVGGDKPVFVILLER